MYVGLSTHVCACVSLCVFLYFLFISAGVLGGHIFLGYPQRELGLMTHGRQLKEGTPVKCPGHQGVNTEDSAEV